MAFEKKTWTDRITEFPTRRTLTKTDGTSEMVTVSRAEGSVSKEGDAFSAANMNNLEKRIEAAVNECFQSVSDGKALVASAITDKGVLTDATATFAEMASNIEQISTSPEYYKHEMTTGTFEDSTYAEHEVDCSLTLESGVYIVDMVSAICLNGGGGGLGINFKTSWNDVTFPSDSTVTLLQENNNDCFLHRIYKVEMTTTGVIVAKTNVIGYYTKEYSLEICALA